MQERLTARNGKGEAYFPECFREPCAGMECNLDSCHFLDIVCEKLAAYEDKECDQKQKKYIGICSECLDYDDGYCDRYGYLVEQSGTCRGFKERERRNT